jgi:hypothetical protein
MKRSGMKKVMFAVTVLAGLAAAATRVYAQDGACCAQLETETRKCASGECSGQVTIRGCAQPDGLNAQQYKITTIKCCISGYDTYVTPTGNPHCGDAVASTTASFSPKSHPIFQNAPMTPEDAAHNAEGFWVRTCAKKFLFIVPPATS